MNQDNDQYREQMEVRLVALLMGEASEFEQAELNEAMAKDTTLAAFYNEMKATMGLVQEASKKFTQEPAQPQPRLSPDRREKLMATFKVVKPKELAKKRTTTRILIEWGAVAVLVLMLASMLLPALSSAKSKAQRVGKSIIPGTTVIPSAPVPDSLATPASIQPGSADYARVEPTAPPTKIFLPNENSLATAQDGESSKSLGVDHYSTQNGQTEFANRDLARGRHGGADTAGAFDVPRSAGRSDTPAKPAAAAPQELADNNDALYAPPAGGARQKQSQESLFFGRYQTESRDQQAAADIKNYGSLGRERGGEFGGTGGNGNVGQGYAQGEASGPATGLPSLGIQWQNAPTDRSSAVPEQPALTAGLKSEEAKPTPTAPVAAGQEVMRVPVAPAPATPPVVPTAPLLGDTAALGRQYLVQAQTPPGAAPTDVQRNLAAVEKAPEPMASPTSPGPLLTIPNSSALDTNSIAVFGLPEEQSSADKGSSSAVKELKKTPGSTKSIAANESRAKDTVRLQESERLRKTEPQQRRATAAVEGKRQYGEAETKLKNDNRDVQSDLNLAKKAEATSQDRNKEVRRYAAIGKEAGKLTQQLDDGSKTSQPPPAAPQSDAPIRKASGPIPTPQPETSTAENAFSTFSLNVSDVTFKLAEASLQNNTLPDPASIRVEEFVNAFNYHDPAPLPGSRLAFAWERAHYPFAHNRDVLRFGIQTAARGRDAQKPLNLVILLDNSGSMERPDRVAIIREALKVLASQLRPQDRISVIAFARTARLWVDGMPGGNPNDFLNKVLDLNPDGGTNLEDAMNLGYETAARHFMPNGVNRVVMLTDGAANLGNVDPDELKKKVIANRQKGIALDCYGIGWEGYNDDLLEVLSHNGDGRYGFLNAPEQAGPEFADQLAGALNVAAADVKTQVEFNPARVTSWRQIGYAKHQLTKEQFRDNTVDAAEIAAAEQGNALYVIEVDPQGSGPIGTVRVRYKVPETGEYIEQSWLLQYQPQVCALENATPAMRLAVTAAAFGEWLSTSPFAAEVTPARLQPYLTALPESFAPDPRPTRLATMIRQAQVLVGK